MGFLQRHMVAHAARFDGALRHLTRVLSADDGDTAEKRLFHKNRGCCYATIITTLPMPMVEMNVEKEGGGDETITMKKKGKRSRRWRVSRWSEGGKMLRF